MLGQDLVAWLSARHQVLAPPPNELDVTDVESVMQSVEAGKPNVLIHAAAFTAVDECERQPELAFRVNADGTRHIAAACHRWHIPLLYVSTDYVFNGGKPEPYLESDQPEPLNVYGRSKLAGEQSVKELVERFWIVRTSWLFGPLGKNFVSAILAQARAGNPLRVVNDQVGSPTYTMDLAAKLEEIVQRAAPGIYHVTNQGHCSWFEFARQILAVAGLQHIPVAPIPTSGSDRPARRPLNSRLANERLETFGLGLLPCWQDALRRYLARKVQPDIST